jgi:hypothetical protein
VRHPDEAQPALALFQLAQARAQLADDSLLVEPAPVAGRMEAEIG